MLRSNLKNKLNIMNAYYDKFIVYTDGACRNNGKVSAVSSIGIYFSNKNLHKINNVSRVLNVSKHTNNIAELTAINESLRIIKEHNIRFPSSSYILIQNILLM